MSNNKPNCYKCVFRGELSDSVYSCCSSIFAVTEFNHYGIRNGWAMHPSNFDPVWLESCLSFSESQEMKDINDSFLKILNINTSAGGFAELTIKRKQIIQTILEHIKLEITKGTFDQVAELSTH